MSPFRLALLIALTLGALVLDSCAPQALPPEPTRTPLPTFTPTAQPTPTLIPTATRSPKTPTPLPALARLYLPSVEKERRAGMVPMEGRFILVDQRTQQMYIYEDGLRVKTIPCSTGIPWRYRTPAWSGTVGEYWGTFFADGLFADDAWFLFTHEGSILIHSLPYTLEGQTRVYVDEEALGQYPSSHGCIRIHPEDARWLKDWNPLGVPIVITRWEP